MIPAITAAKEATAVMVKESCIVRFRYLAQQGERRTGENIRNTARMAISKELITITFIKQ
jgi:hypothetical protein